MGYKISENLEFGGIASFSLLDSDLYSTTLFGIGPYANYYFVRNFYATAQFQEYIVTQKLNVQEIEEQEAMKLHYTLVVVI